MVYRVEITIPAETPSTSPAETSMTLCEGTITRSSILFPAGCAGLAYVQIWLGGFQLVPWTRGNWIRGDDHQITVDVGQNVGPAPRLLIVKGYNLDETYPHTIAVSVDVTPFYPIPSTPSPSTLLAEFGLGL